MSGPCCSVGARPDAAEIDAALRDGQGLGTVAKRHGLVKGTLGRHRQKCLGITTAASPETAETPRETGAETVPGASLKLAESLTETARETRLSPRPFANVPPPADEYTDTSPRRLITAEVEDRCMDLRVAGRSYEQIAAEVGIARETAVAAVDRVLMRTIGQADERAEKARSIELRRCDAIIASFWERATDPSMAKVDVPADTESGVKAYDGQDKAADRLLKAMERRAKLLGLDAPTGPAVHVNITVGEFGGAVGRFIAAAAPDVAGLFAAWCGAIQVGDAQAKSDPAAWVAGRRQMVETTAEGGP